MSWPEDMELVHKSVRGALMLGPKSITQGFCLPRNKHQ
jgi:hypothetical protein